MQKVTRTRPTDKAYNFDPRSFENLEKFLNAGFRVVMCNRIGDDLEYILEKEDE